MFEKSWLTKCRSISMVHARAFSFTDDSMSVAYPAASAVTNAGAIGNSLTGPHSLDTALLLFELRYAQSCWYQELFQSSRDPLQNSSTYIWQMCHEMREWSESFPETFSFRYRDEILNEKGIKIDHGVDHSGFQNFHGVHYHRDQCYLRAHFYPGIPGKHFGLEWI